MSSTVSISVEEKEEKQKIIRIASRKKAYLEAAFELGTRLVHGLVAFQQLHYKDGKMLI